MATIEYEGGTGGKFRKRPLRRVSSTPYDRPPLAASGIHGPTPETEAGGSGWFSKIVDPASQVIVRNASRLLSVFGKGLAAPPGEQINIVEEVPKVTVSPELREHGENPADVRLSRHYDGTDRSEQELISRNDSIFELEQLLKQKRFSRVEIDHLAELLHSRTIESSIFPSTDYKNKGKINEDSSINSSSSQQAVNHEEMEKGKANPSKLECQIEQQVNLNENVTSGVHVNIFEEGFDSPIDIARAYMGLKPRKAALSSLGLQNQTCHRDEVSLLNFRFGNKPSNAAIASSSAVCFPVIPRGAGNDILTQKPQSRSALYKLSRSPYGRSFMWTNPRGYSPYKDNNVELTRSLEWTPTPSNTGHGQALLKRGSSKRDAGFFGDAQRTCQKSCLKDLNFSTPVNTSSTFILNQEYKHDIDTKGLDNLDCEIPSSSLHVPPHSVETAKKILHQLDKLSSFPQNKSSEKKVIVGDASLSNSSFSASHERSLKIKANNGSTKLLTVRGSRNLEEPSSSNLARITSSASPSKDKAEGEASLIPYISVGQVASGIVMNSSGTSAPLANYNMKSMMESNGHGFSPLSMQKEPTVQSAPDDNDEPTKAEQAILFSVKDPMEKSFEGSFEYVPTSGLTHTDSDTKAFNETYTERNVSFNFLAARTFNTLSKRLLSSTMAITLADGATSKEVPTYNATKPISSGISERLNAGSLSVVSSSKGYGAPKFQFGPSIYSFTGLSAVCSSIGNGVFGVGTSPASVGSSFHFSSTGSNLQAAPKL